MAEDAAKEEKKEEPSGEGGGDEGGGDDCNCPPPGLPGWMGTFSDLVTLLLTFFVLLLSFAKTETAKYEAALGSVRNAFGGNVLKLGEVVQLGKSPDDSPTMLDAQDSARPFPIEFLTTEGMLDKKEINRDSDEDANVMGHLLKEYDLAESAEIQEIPEGVKVKMKDRLFFEEGSVEIKSVSVEVFEKMVKLLKENDWSIFVEGYSSLGETSKDNKDDALVLSSRRASAVTKVLIKRGIRPDRITTVFYGDSRPVKETGNSPAVQEMNRRVEFIIRKKDLGQEGKKLKR